jgi:redox-sensitive bicupin YhaK (pirin superfamily)
LRKGNQRTRLKSGVAVAGEAERMARTATGIETVMPEEADGLAAWMWRLPPGGSAELPDPARSGGQYMIVASGTMANDAELLDRLSTVFVSPEEQAYSVTAGSDGLDLLVLQFPRMAGTLAGGQSRI